MNKKVGILGGSFNPIHLGHIHLAETIKKVKGLDEIWFIPTFINPFKEKEPPISEKHRLKMCELAIEGNPDFKVLDIEINKKEPSYTYNTIKALKSEYPKIDFFLILGDDAASSFSSWYEADKMLEEIPVIVGARVGGNLKNFQGSLINMPIMLVSSTEIRDLIQKNKDFERFLPEKVTSYIKKHKLYSDDEKI